MLNTQAFDQISDIITAEDFYRADHRVIFDAIAALHLRGEPADVITVYNELERSGRADAAGRPYLNALTSNSLGAGNIRTYAEIVRDCSMLRQLVSAADTIAASALAPEGRETKDIIDDAEKLVLQINESADRGNKGFVRLNKLAANVSDIVAERYRTKSANDVTGVSTGYRYLDQLTSGMQPGDLIIIAGRPSMGKTAFTLTMARNMSVDHEQAVAFFSLEMPAHQLMMRLVVAETGIPGNDLKLGRLSPEQWRHLESATKPLGTAPLFIDDTPALTTLELRARARRLKAEKGLGLVIVDYLQLMRTSRRTDSRELEISDISRSLKGLAKEMNVPVVALSQLNRKVEERGDKRPMLSDLRESGAIEQDADVIMFVYRDDVYKFTKPADRPVQGIAEIIIGKQRNGPVGVAELLYMSPYTAFEDLAPDWAPSETPQ